MTSVAFAEIAALAGDPARANMLHALMDGGCLTASMLARVAGVSPQTASSHLKLLIEGGLIAVEKQGRFHHHRLASPLVAEMLEAIMQVAAHRQVTPARRAFNPKDEALRKARTCYDHFAGKLGVALADALVAQGIVDFSREAALVTDTGLSFLRQAGIGNEALLTGQTSRTGRVMCRVCFDWSEHRPHLGGAVGAAICSHSMMHGWTRRIAGTRALLITPEGERIFRDVFRMSL